MSLGLRGELAHGLRALAEHSAAGLCLLACLVVVIHAAEPPAIPVGLDAYRQWERWPYLRIGMRAYMRSTYDRSGGNEGADAGHFLYQRADDFNVALDVEGAGVLCFTRYNHWHGSPWHYVVDGTDHLVQETSTADPLAPVSNSTFIPSALFPPPLALTWSFTRGADLSWVPIPFEKSLQLAYGRTHYGTGYYIYQQFVPGIPLSHPVKTWDATTPPGKDVLELINRAGTDLAPPGLTAVGGKVRSLDPGATALLSDVRPGEPAMLRALDFSAPRAQAVEFGRTRLRVTWDNDAFPSIEAPLALFFGAGTLYNRDGREFLVKAFPMTIRFDDQRVHLACYFPMPFFRSARIELVGNASRPVTDIDWRARYEAFHGSRSDVGLFHATYRDHPSPVRGHDLILLDTREAEGGGEWSGHFVGTSFIFSNRAVLNTLEGDPRFFFDDSQTPQAQGTGTEEWGGGGDYWGGQNMTLAFAGHPTGAKNDATAVNDEDKIESAYRFLLGDLMPFGQRALICLEHGGTNESTEHYQTVTYWYGRRGASLIETDSLKVGDAASEAAHHYVSPEASAPYELTSRYELGPDSLKVATAAAEERGGAAPAAVVEIYPASTDYGRKTSRSSEFTLKLEPRNLGVMLRRKLDYQFFNQRAEVFVSDERGSDWQPAGIWYLAGANTGIRSNPPQELGPARHIVQVSNRRFRDDEFLLPRKLTQGRGAIRVRVKFAPIPLPLFPGGPAVEMAWSEIRYDAYCFILPGEAGTLESRPKP
jgi:hypothetical protein